MIQSVSLASFGSRFTNVARQGDWSEFNVTRNVRQCILSCPLGPPTDLRWCNLRLHLDHARLRFSHVPLFVLISVHEKKMIMSR